MNYQQRYKHLMDPEVWSSQATEKRPHMRGMVLEFTGTVMVFRFIKRNHSFMGMAPFAIIKDQREKSAYIDFRFDREQNQYETLIFAGTIEQYIHEKTYTL